MNKMTSGELLYGKLTESIIGAAFAVHNALGKGLHERTYENALVQKLRSLGFRVTQQASVPVFFENKKVGDQVVDLVVDDKIIIEIKAAERLHKSHESQLLGYLKNTKFQLGLLINFGSRVEFKRLIYTVQNR